VTIDVDAFLAFIEAHLLSMVAAIFFFAFVVFMVRMNSANGPYQHFKLAHLFMTKEGMLDRKVFRENVLFFVTVYGFIHVVHKAADMTIEYLSAMTGIWLGAHVLNDKFPSRMAPPIPPEDDHK
jgi:hypothetical protein